MILGRVASLQCKVSHAATVVVAVHWLHNNNPLRLEGNPRVSVRQDGTLEIQEVRAADVGTYTCVVSSYVCVLSVNLIAVYLFQLMKIIVFSIFNVIGFSVFQFQS